MHIEEIIARINELIAKGEEYCKENDDEEARFMLTCLYRLKQYESRQPAAECQFNILGKCLKYKTSSFCSFIGATGMCLKPVRTRCYLGSPCEYQNPDIRIPEKTSLETVVHCGECVHRYRDKRCAGRDPNWFCARGRRRES